MYFSVEQVIQRLGISKSEANALDAIDGKKDNKIQQDIFTQANEALQTAETIKQSGESVMDLSKLSNVAKCIAKTFARKMGLEAYFYSKEENFNSENITDSEKDTHHTMLELTAMVTDYVREHKTLEGFKFKNAPTNISNLKVEIDDYFEDSNNNEIVFDKDGNGYVKKVIDGIAVELKYKLNNNDYSFGFIVPNETDDD